MKFLFLNPRQRPFWRARRRRRGGVGVVEAALCIVFVLLPITLGGFQFAMVFLTQHALQQVARESARYAAVHYNETTFDANENQGNVPKSPRSLKNVIRRQAAANGFAWKEINGTLLPGNLKGSIVVTPAPDARLSGQPLTITITYPMKRRAFLGSLFFAKEVVIKGKKTRQFDPLRLGFLNSNFSASSTILME